MITIKSTLEEMKNTVEKGLILSPGKWIEYAIQLNSLWQDLKDEVTKAEIEYLRQVEECQSDKDISHARAVTIAKTLPPKEEGKMNTYQFYQYLKGRDQIIGEFIKLSKKRATLETNYS